MSRYREWDLACKVYVGNLGSSASKHEIENAFGKYGPLRNVWVARNPPGFAFVEFVSTNTLYASNNICNFSQTNVFITGGSS